MKNNIKVGLILFFIGLIGIFSILTMDIPFPEEALEQLDGKLSPFQIKLLALTNPTILLLIAIIIGASLYKKFNFQVPIIERLVGSKKDLELMDIIKYGIIGGILSGVLITLSEFLFSPTLPIEFTKLSESLKPTLLARFLYGGITEEILMRFGFMTFIVWIASKILSKNNPIIFWIGILISSLIFAVGHFPIAYQVVESPSVVLLTYIIIGNTIGGVIFGWLYWKKGLESAMIAHIFTHIILVLITKI